MVALNFPQRFVPPIVSYRKRRTIRQHGKRRPPKPGEYLQLYTGMRTKACRKILENDPFCMDLSEITIEIAVDRIEQIKVNGSIITDTMDEFAIGDGFEGSVDMHRYWLKSFGPGVFEGNLITWLLRGICQFCGCTDIDCSQCVAAQGDPCYWVDRDHTICSRCFAIGGAS